MPDILYRFPISAPVQRVFEAVSLPEGLDSWWTKSSRGTPTEYSDYSLFFSPEYDWRAIVERGVAPSIFELRLTRADADWSRTLVGFRLESRGEDTMVEFYHTGWAEANEHYRVSGFCWAMYLRLMKQYCETGQVIPYDLRLEA